MSTIKSSAENLTLNADGANNDVIIQSNGSTLVTVDGSATNVGIGTTTPAQKLTINTGYVQVGNGIGGGGGVKYPYSAANAACRNWRTRSDMQEYGDWGIEQSTTQSGESYDHIFKITQAGDVNVNTGDLYFGAAGKGIVLGATSNTAANTLDDYEVGTFTPTSSFTTKNIVASNCLYTKVGRMVHVQIYFTAVPNSVNWNMGNLPFTSAKSSTWSVGAGNNLYLQSFGRIDANSTSFVGLMSGTSSSNTEFYISLTYATA